MNTLYQKINKGFTLIELLLYISISSIIILTTSAYLNMYLETNIKNETIREVDQQGAFVMSTIIQTLRNAESITSPAIGLSQNSLTVNTFTPAKNPTIFNVNAGVLEIKEGLLNPIPLTNNLVNVSTLTFSNFSHPSSPGIIKVSFTINSNNDSGRNEYSFTKDFVSAVALHQP